MIRLQDVVSFLREFAPPELAEDWDNVGLLIGDPADEIQSVLTCLTLTPNVADEAISRGVQLVITHHPVLFRPVQRLTAETSEGRILLSLIRAGISVYSPHTSYDSAANGINAQLAQLFELRDVQPLRANAALATGTQPAGSVLGKRPVDLCLAERRHSAWHPRLGWVVCCGNRGPMDSAFAVQPKALGNAVGSSCSRCERNRARRLWAPKR